MSAESVRQFREGCRESDQRRDAGLKTPEDIKRYDDISYGPFRENLLDVYCLKDTEGLSPTIINVHGGGWVYGDKELYQFYCMSLAQRGFTVVNFTYRLAPENRYPAALEDCFKVLEWIEENGKDYHIDLENLFMVGDSAGGQLAHQICCILTNRRYRKLFDLRVPEHIRINACALNCGCYMMMVNHLIPPLDATMTKDYLPEDYRKYIRQYAVIANTSKDFPPAFVMTAHEDALKFMARPLYWRLKLMGVESELHIYGEKGNKEIGHVFHVNMRLDEARRCNDDECEFFRRHMKGTENVQEH